MSTALTWIKATLPCILFVAAPALSQVIQTGRIEFPVTAQETEKFSAASLGTQGLMVYRRLNGKKEDQIELLKIDTALHEQWKGYVNINKSLVLQRVQHRQDLFFFMLLKDRNYVGGDFKIISVKLENGNYGVSDVKNLIPFMPTEFILTNQAAMIGGYFNSRPIVLYYSFALQRAKVLPGFFNSPGELNQLRTYDDGSVDVIVSSRNFEKRRALWIRNYDAQGDLVKTTILQPDEDKNLLFGRSLKGVNGDQIVAGVYGRFTDYSRGIFVAGIRANGEYAIQYYNFAELGNFFSYMKAKRQNRVKERIERRTIKGKKVKFNYRILVQELFPYQNQYVMLGEAFYPHYVRPNNRSFHTASTLWSFDPQVRTDMIFDGYQYTHAVVIGLSPQGKLLWDNSFEINDVKSYELEQFVKVKTESERIILMYLFDNEIRTKIINNEQVVEGKSSGKLKTSDEGEMMDKADEHSDHMNYWYDDYLFAYGTLTLRKGMLGPQRRVFFINKITYR